MRFLRPLLGYTKLVCQTNVDIREELKVQSTVEDIQTYQKNWKEHVKKVQDERLPILAFKYKQTNKIKNTQDNSEITLKFVGETWTLAGYRWKSQHLLFPVRMCMSVHVLW
jgi:hypothetical protein